MKAEGQTDKTELGENVLQGSLLEWELGTWLLLDETVEGIRNLIIGDTRIAAVRESGMSKGGL